MSTTRTRTQSFPNLRDSLPSPEHNYDDSALEGVAANVKLLLKLIQDHKDACKKEQKDGRRMLRVAGMMTVLDNVRNRIKKCQSFGNKRSEAELRRCNTDVKANPPREKRAGEGLADDDKQKLRKDLNASLAARKSLEIMCSSIGKEKEIMAAELSRKNYELSELEEHVNDLKRQNETLLEKVKEFAATEHEEQKLNKGKSKAHGNVADLHVRNKELSEQLLRSLDGYRSMKMKLRETREEALVMRETMEEMSEKVGAGLQRVHAMKQLQIERDIDKLIDVKEGTSEVEHVFECLEMMVSKHVQRKV